MTKKVTIRLLDEVSVFVHGLDEYHHDHLYNKYGVFAPNYFFNPKFKLGRWDGKIRYYQQTGRTFLYLLDEILPQVAKWGYKIDLEDRRSGNYASPDLIDNNIFAHITHLDTGKPIVLRDDQVSAVNSLIQDGNGLCIAATGAGKAQSLDSLILTPRGWRRMGDITVGDTVIAPDNTTANVVGVYPQGKRPLYRVTFHDGSSTLCCDEHLWTVNMPVKPHSAVTSTQTVQLSAMREFLDRKKAENSHTPGNISVQVVAPIDFREGATQCTVDPYLVGVLIGDGGLSDAGVVLSSKDDHIITKVSRLIEQYDVTLKFCGGGDYRLTKKEPQSSFPPPKNRLTEQLSDLGLMATTSHTKFIPAAYQTAPIVDRWQLLRGLMDTDGTVDTRGNASFTTVSRQLAVDVQQLVWSLGGVCTITNRTTSYVYGGEQKTGSIAYTLFIRMTDNSQLFTLPRKKERCKKTFADGRVALTRRIVSIEYERDDYAQCIMIDNQSHLYITDDYVVTHNTFMCAALCTAYDKKGIRTLTIVPDQTLIKQTKRDYINCGLDTGEYSGSEKSTEHAHVVSTWQALKNNPKIVELFQMVIVDECHGLRGNVLQNILIDHCANVPYRFGFTGTLPKEQTDRLAVFVAVGSVKHSIGARELIDMGQLANLHIDIIQLEEDLQKQYKEFCDEVNFGNPPTYTQFKDGYFPDFSAEKSYLHRNSDRIAWIAAYIEAKRNNKKGNVLCLVDNIAFGRQLAQFIPNAIFVNGQDIKKVEDRQVVYDLFKDRDDLVVIATVHIAGTGLSIRRIFNLVLVDVGKSFVRVIQAIGRGLRMADDKDSVSISDICSDLKYGKKHLKQRIDYYNEAQYPFKKHKVDYHKLMRSPFDDSDE